MFRMLVRVSVIVAAFASISLSAANTLDIYFIDVEGGQSTLFVTPARESLLVDTGWAGNDRRDANRIVAAARDAGLKQIDYVLITHFHPDHDGGIVDLAPQMPIRTFIDHGALDPAVIKETPQTTIDAYNAYVKIRATGKHLEPKPGDRLPLEDLEVTFVASDRQTIARAVSGATVPNLACAGPFPPAGDTQENPRSTGFHLRFGEFRFIDLGDLSGPPLYDLVCPANKLGVIDAYLVSHHGGRDNSHPSLAAALKPRIAILNSGETKGGDPDTFAMLRAANGIEDIWQIHRFRNQGRQSIADERIANLDETTGHWLKLSANADGSFSVTNGRTGVKKDYPRRVSR